MPSELIGVVCLILALVWMILGMRVGYAFFFLAAAGFLLLKNWGVALSVLGLSPYTQIASWSYVVMPMFILMGLLLSETGLADEVFVAAEKWFGHLPGGLALAVVVGSTGFAACTGSSTASCMVAGKLFTRRMIGSGYSRSFSTALVAATSGLAILIPPSVTIVFYGMITQQSIGALLIAGIFPGLLCAAIFFIQILFMSRIRPGTIGPAQAQATRRERLASLKGSATPLGTLTLMLAGLYLGIFTPTEAGAVATFVLFIYCIARRRMNWKVLRSTLEQTLDMTVMIFVLTIGSMIFGNFMALSGGTARVLDYIISLGLGPTGFLMMIYALYFVMGMFVGTWVMMVLTVPMVFPLIVGLGFDPIWFGIIMIMWCEVGNITPPIGWSVFVMARVTPEVPMEEIYKGVWPFVICNLLTIAFLTVFPRIVTFLPAMMHMG